MHPGQSGIEFKRWQKSNLTLLFVESSLIRCMGGIPQLLHICRWCTCAAKLASMWRSSERRALGICLACVECRWMGGIGWMAKNSGSVR